ncbi:MAG: hypothetical protein ABW221_28305 [Vicinamibacteria bacterium]
MTQPTLIASVAAFVLLAGQARGQAAPPRSPAPRTARGAASARLDAELGARAHAIFAHLRSLTHIAGPPPDLVVTDDPLPTAVAEYSKVIVTRRLLRLCANVRSTAGTDRVRTRDGLIAFVLAHELEHLARRDPGSFGSRTESGAVEQDADDKATGRLVVAGIHVDAVEIADLLAMIRMESGAIAPAEVRARARTVRASLRETARLSREWHVGWLLAVAGEFDRALEFYTNVAGRYPYALPMYTLAITRLQTAWRVHPCSDRDLLEWLPPLRHDPRTQVVPFQVRGPDDACALLRKELDRAAGELGQVPDHAPALVALAAIRLLQGEEKATIDPTRAIGGVKGVGIACAEPAGGARSRTEADACQVSLLAQYEMSRRSPQSRAVAIEGLERLRKEWPSEPSLQFNLARLLTHARRHDEARPLWEEFRQAPGNALHRQEAATALERYAPTAVRSSAAVIEPSPAVLEAGAASADRLAASSEGCRSDRKWRTVSSASLLTYCGDWSKEIGVRNREGTLVRSIALGPDTAFPFEPPSSPPLFATTNSQGEELRIWADQAWVLDGKTPRRAVYFKRK